MSGSNPKERFVGTWALTSSEFRRADGQEVYPRGKNPAGRLMYDTNGYMAAQVMGRDRPPFATGDILGGTPDEIKTALEGYQAYYGTYEVNDDEATVIHHVEGGLFPNWIGADQKRFFKFTGNRLTLGTAPMQVGGQITGTLVWERLT